MGEVGLLSPVADFIPLTGPVRSFGLAWHEEQITTASIPRIWKEGGIWSSLSLQTFAMRLCGNNQQDKLLVLFSTLRVTLGTVWALLFCFVPSKMRTGTLPVANVSGKGWERHRELVTRRKSLIVNHKSFAHNAPFFLLPLKKESSFYSWSEACGSTIPDLGWDYLSRCGKNRWWQVGCINHGALKSKTCILILKKSEFSSIGNILIKGLLKYKPGGFEDYNTIGGCTPHHQ